MQGPTGAAATDNAIRKLLRQAEKAGRRVEGAHPIAAGLRVRVEPTGTASFVWYGSEPGGKRRLFHLGYFPEVTAAAAAHALRALKLERKVAVQTGRPFAAHRSKRRDFTGLTMRQLVALFYWRELRRRKRDRAPILTLKRHVLGTKAEPLLGSMPVASVLPEDVRHVIEILRNAGKHTQAGKVLALIRQMFRLAVFEGVITQSPAADLTRSGFRLNPGKRTRRLTDPELGTLWAAFHNDNTPTSRTSRLALAVLLATGRRTGELLLAKRRDMNLDAGAWRIPAENRKASSRAAAAKIEDDLVSLPRQTVEDLRALRAMAPDSIWAVGTPSDSVSGRISDTTLARALRDMQIAGAFKLAGPATPHAFRHALRATVGEKRWCSPAAAELLLGHQLPGIVGVYDVGSYHEERAAALQRWADYLDGLAGRTQVGVVNLDTARG